MLNHDHRQRFREAEQIDNHDDWLDQKCARDFLRWKIVKWFVISAFVFALGMSIGLAVRYIPIGVLD